MNLIAILGGVGLLGAGVMNWHPSWSLPVDHSTFETTSSAKKHYVNFFVLGGHPKNADAANAVTILVNQAYAVGFAQSRKNPAWSAYHVDKIKAEFNGVTSTLNLKHDRPDPFYTDTRIPEASQLPGHMTFGSPYHRGHMTPNNAIQKEFGRLAQLETFFMTNMCPQNGTLNVGIWATLEHKITSDLASELNDIWVIAGPIFKANPSHITKSGNDTGVDIPSAFYMILVEQTHWSGTLDGIAFRFPNNSTGLAGKTLPDFVVTIDSIEIATQLDFFSEFSATKQKNLEENEGEYDEWF